MNNPLPRWWVWLFVITILFSAVYLAMYPGLGNSPGKLGWTSTGQHKAEMEKGNKEVAPLYAKFASMKPRTLPRIPGHGHWRAFVHEQLRAVSRFRCPRQQRLSQSDRW